MWQHIINKGELLKLTKEEGVELTNEQLEAISGGGVCDTLPTTSDYRYAVYACSACNSPSLSPRADATGHRCLLCKKCGKIYYF